MTEEKSKSADREPSRVTKQPSADPLVVERLVRRAQESIKLGQLFVKTYQEEMLDYSKLSELALINDVMVQSTHLVEALLKAVRNEHQPDEAFERDLRQSAIRRFHQGISLRALLQSYRLWGRVFLKEIIAGVDRRDLTEVEAAFEVAEQIMAHVDRASSVVAESYFAEMAGVSRDAEVLRTDALEELLKLRTHTPETGHVINSLPHKLSQHNAVVVLRIPAENWSESSNLREEVKVVRSALKDLPGDFVVGIREREIVAIRSTKEPLTNEALHLETQALASGLSDHVVAYGRPYLGIDGIAKSYNEAAEAADFGAARSMRGEPISFVQILFEHILRASPHSQDVIGSTIEPVRNYDAAHGTVLLDTLQTYFDSRFSLSRSAELLHVHPNTVTYRLRRIHELTGLNVLEPNDLLLLSLGLKLARWPGPGPLWDRASDL